MFVFPFDIKTATVCSIITILVAQASKLGFILTGPGLGAYELSMLPAMVSGAVLGGSLGSLLKKRMNERGVQAAFYGVQLLVMLICIINIVRSL